MDKKRFEKSKSDITDYRIYDYEKEDAYFINCDDESTVDAIVDLLNELYEDNRQLEVLLQEAEDEIARLKKSNKQWMESLVNMESEG